MEFQEFKYSWGNIWMCMSEAQGREVGSGDKDLEISI